MSRTRSYLSVPAFLILLVVGLPLAAQDDANQRLFGRKWTCHATIFLVGSGQQYTPAKWRMKTGDPDAVWSDREKSCKRYIQAEFLTGSIWNHLSLTPDQQNQVCRKGRGDFRIEYGFDNRPKSWTFTDTVPAPPCDCEIGCKSGYDLDTTSDPRNPRCVRVLCEGAANGIPNDRFGPHDSGVGIWSGNVYHHQPVQRGRCTFEG